MRHAASAVAVFIGAYCARESAALAEPLTGSLTVERALGAEACPDQQALVTEVEQIAGAPILSGTGAADVTLALRITPATPSGFSAVLVVSGKRNGERTLDDVGPGCDVLARGLAVTIAILLEAGPGAVPEPPKPPEPPGPPPVPWWRKYYLLPAIEAPPPVPAEDEGIPPIVASIGATYDSATLSSDAVGLTLGVDTYIKYVSFGVGFVWLPKEQRDLNTFHVDYAYAGGRVRACARDPFIEQFGISACARFSAGRRTATLVNELTDAHDDNHGAYLSLGPQVEISRRLVGPFGIYADVAADFPLLQADLTVADPVGGTVIDDPEHVVSIDIGIGVRFWLEPPRPETKREKGVR
ncbi:MAG: hypothetical protein HOV80_39630 [Polyangiaceae bacterium]|nr:hypothetical protein [Polyangiaceae bacterium]